jgi:hypothetical protein
VSPGCSRTGRLKHLREICILALYQGTTLVGP